MRKTRSDKGRKHDRQPSTGLECVYYSVRDHALVLVVTVDEGRQISHFRKLSTYEAADAAEQLVELRDEILAALGRQAQDDSAAFAHFKRAVAT